MWAPTGAGTTFPISACPSPSGTSPAADPDDVEPDGTVAFEAPADGPAPADRPEPADRPAADVLPDLAWLFDRVPITTPTTLNTTTATTTTRTITPRPRERRSPGAVPGAAGCGHDDDTAGLADGDRGSGHDGDPGMYTPGAATPAAAVHAEGVETGDSGSVTDGRCSDSNAVGSGIDVRASPAAVSGSGGQLGGADCWGQAGGDC